MCVRAYVCIRMCKCVCKCMGRVFICFLIELADISKAYCFLRDKWNIRFSIGHVSHVQSKILFQKCYFSPPLLTQSSMKKYGSIFL